MRAAMASASAMKRSSAADASWAYRLVIVDLALVLCREEGKAGGAYPSTA
jgi:hypothetical protein